MKNFLSTNEVKLLKSSHRSIHDKKVADRIKAILSLNDGWEFSVIAQILLLDESTLRRYVRRFKESGVSGLMESRYIGGFSKLTITQEVELSNFLSSQIFLTSKDICEYVFEKYSVRYSVAGMTKLLHRLGFKYKKPAVVPGKSDEVKQLEHLDKYNYLKENLREQDDIWFVDATHPSHNTNVVYGWIKKGERKQIQTNTGRERINLSEAWSLKNKQAVVQKQEKINTQSTISLLQTLMLHQPFGKLYLILDNASYYHSKELKQFLKRYNRIKPIHLPSYSPNLNIIERLWKYLHQKILANKYHKTFKEFEETILTFFQNQEEHSEALATLMTDNFQIIRHS